MSLPSWNIRPYQPGDESAIVALFNTVFHQERTVAHWRWKFLENPVGRTFISLAVTPDNDIVGQYALLPVWMWAGGRRVLGALSLDTMTHPDFQGQGMFTRLAEDCLQRAAEEGLAVAFGFPNPNSYPGFMRRLAWSDLGRVGVWGRPLHLEQRLGPAGRLLQTGYDVRFGTARYQDAELAPADHFFRDEIAERLGKPWGGGELAAVERSLAYLAWRYGSCPDRRYQVCWWGDGDPDGVVVYFEEGHQAKIVDLLAASPEAVAPTLGTAIKALRGERLLAASLWQAPTPTFARALQTVGFRPLKTSSPFIVRLLEAPTELLNPGAWYLSAGDCDVY